jgi:hypothetical protein
VPKALYDQLREEHDWLRRRVEELVEQASRYQVLLQQAQGTPTRLAPVDTALARAGQTATTWPATAESQRHSTAAATSRLLGRVRGLWRARGNR